MRAAQRECARLRAEGRQGLAGPAGRGLDRPVVIGQRGQVNGLPGGGGDHRPQNLVLVLVVGADLGEQRRGVAADGARLRGRCAAAGDLGQAGGEPPQVLAYRPVDHHHRSEVRLRLRRGLRPEREWPCACHIPSLGRGTGGRLAANLRQTGGHCDAEGNSLCQRGSSDQGQGARAAGGDRRRRSCQRRRAEAAVRAGPADRRTRPGGLRRPADRGSVRRRGAAQSARRGAVVRLAPAPGA